MLIPFGVLSAASGGEPVALSDYELIGTAFGTGSSPTIEFTSIPQSFKHLQVRWTARATSTSRTQLLKLNGATTGYAHHGVYANSSNVLSEQYVSQTSIALFSGISSSSSGSGQIGLGIMDILDYSSTTKNTTTRTLYGLSTDNPVYIALHSGLFSNTQAITSIALTMAAGNFASISRFSLYGLKG
jgi:hypothetical protein